MIVNLAIEIFRRQNRGITFTDIMKHFQVSKGSARLKLKRLYLKGDLFTIGRKRPQAYYPSNIKAEVKEKMARKVPIDPTGVSRSDGPHLSASDRDFMILETLEGHVLPLLPRTPAYIHNIHLKVSLPPDCYLELNELPGKQHRGKSREQKFGPRFVIYTFYKKGAVDIVVKCSRNPIRIKDEGDVMEFFGFLGQVRDRLISSVNDEGERFVPELGTWQLAEFDLNKDVKLHDIFQFSAFHVQVKHMGHVLRSYVKSMGKETVLRVEKSISSRKDVLGTLLDTFPPRQQTGSQDEQLLRIECMLEYLASRSGYKLNANMQINKGITNQPIDQWI